MPPTTTKKGGSKHPVTKLIDTVEDLEQHFHDAADAANEAARIWTSARGSVDKLNEALDRAGTGVFTLGQGISELQGKFGTGTALPDFVKAGRSQDSGPEAAAYRKSVEDQFADLSRRIKAATNDPNNFFAKNVDETIGYLRDNRLSPQEAITRLQQVLWNWQGGLFQDMSDPNTSREFRQLAAELERFIVSGRI